MGITIEKMVEDFALAFKELDGTRPQGRSKTRVYQAGIGPLSEDQSIHGALSFLKQWFPQVYKLASPQVYPSSRQKCDLVIPNQWAIEFKLIRPFGDNGKEAEQWSENVLHPYPGNTSAIGDCLKLINSGFNEKKAIIIFGFEHTPPVLDITIAIKAFEKIATEVVGIKLGEKYVAEFNDLIHPVHQKGKVFGWEIL